MPAQSKGAKNGGGRRVARAGCRGRHQTEAACVREELLGEAAGDRLISDESASIPFHNSLSTPRERARPLAPGGGRLHAGHSMPSGWMLSLPMSKVKRPENVSEGREPVGIAISTSALGISATSALFARRQLELVDRRRGAKLRGDVVAGLESFAHTDNTYAVGLRSQTQLQRSLRDVDVSPVQRTDQTALEQELAEVAPALLRGERSRVTLDVEQLTRDSMTAAPWSSCMRSTTKTAGHVTSGWQWSSVRRSF